MKLTINVDDDDVIQMLRNHGFEVPDHKVDDILFDKEVKEQLASDLVERWRSDTVYTDVFDSPEERFKDCMDRLGIKFVDPDEEDEDEDLDSGEGLYDTDDEDD